VEIDRIKRPISAALISRTKVALRFLMRPN
jgi:hypothetical protein